MKLSFGQTARKLGLLYAQVWAMAKAGRIPYETVGNFKFIDSANLPAVLQAAIDAGYMKGYEPAQRTSPATAAV